MTKLCPRGKAAAKRKFKVYPSAYANAYASKICAGKIKDPSGVKRKDFRGPKPAGKVVGGVISTVGKVLGKKGIKYLKSPEGRKKTKEIMDSPLPKNMKEKLEKLKKAFGKRAGGMTAGSMSGMGRLQKARMMNKGGGADTGTMGERKSQIGVAINKFKRRLKKDKSRLTQSDIEKAKRIQMKNKGGDAKISLEEARELRRKAKQRKQKQRFERKYPGPARPGNPVVAYEVKKGGLTSELNNPAKGYTKGGMADYYKDLM